MDRGRRCGLESRDSRVTPSQRRRSGTRDLGGRGSREPVQCSEGVGGVGNTPKEFATFIRTEMDKWARAVRESGAKVE